jgi:hypothetical protein
MGLILKKPFMDAQEMRRLWEMSNERDVASVRLRSMCILCEAVVFFVEKVFGGHADTLTTCKRLEKAAAPLLDNPMDPRGVVRWFHTVAVRLAEMERGRTYKDKTELKNRIRGQLPGFIQLVKDTYDVQKRLTEEVAAAIQASKKQGRIPASA